MHFPMLRTPKKKRFLLDQFVLRQNTIYEKGVIKTRKGIKPGDEFLYEVGVNSEESFALTEAVLFKNKRYNRLCVQLRALGGFQYLYDFKLVSEMGVITNAAEIEIGENENGVRKPMNMFCFSAGATKGCGIYAFINILHSGDKYEMEIYELSKDLSRWLRLSEGDIYIPDYLSGGRGVNYLKSPEKLPEPQNKEPLNMLGGVCRLSFTTDGFSGSFYLPVQSADDKAEHIRASYIADEYRTLEFSFPKGAHVSNSVNFAGYEVYLTYNNGFLSFGSTPAGFIPDRLSGVTDNLKVLVKHETEESYEKIAFMTKAAVMGLGGAGEQVVLSGNQKHPSLVVVSNPANPLYYPQNICFNVGSDEDAVIGAASVKNKLALFKEGSVYFAEIKGGKYSLSLVSDRLGCREAASVRSVGNAAIFVGNDSKLYALMGSGAIKEISTNIRDFLDDFKFVEHTCSSVSSSRYILFADRRAYCLDLKRSDAALDKPEWDIWTLPYEMNLCGVFEHADRTIILGCTTDNYYKKYYICNFSGEGRDTYYAAYDYYMNQSEETILTTIKSGLINPDNSFSHKMLERAIFYVDNNANIKTEFRDDKGDIIKRSGINISYEKKGKKPIRLYPLIPVVQFELTLETEAPLELQGIELSYYNLD